MGTWTDLFNSLSPVIKEGTKLGAAAVGSAINTAAEQEAEAGYAGELARGIGALDAEDQQQLLRALTMKEAFTPKQDFAATALQLPTPDQAPAQLQKQPLTIPQALPRMESAPESSILSKLFLTPDERSLQRDIGQQTAFRQATGQIPTFTEEQENRLEAARQMAVQEGERRAILEALRQQVPRDLGITQL